MQFLKNIPYSTISISTIRYFILFQPFLCHRAIWSRKAYYFNHIFFNSYLNRFPNIIRTVINCVRKCFF